MGLQAEFRSGLLFPIPWRPWRLGVSITKINRQDAKDAKVGFMELYRRCGYKALS